MSRRSADATINSKRVMIDGIPAVIGQQVSDENAVSLDGKLLKPQDEYTTLMLNKPVGYVCSRKGQGSKTIYNLLPKEYFNLKPVGRLDKDSSGLLLLTNDGELANELTHPSNQKEKIYRLKLNKSLTLSDKNKLLSGVKLSDGLSKFIKIKDCSNDTYEVVMNEGRNRQIRRSLNSIGYKIDCLHRIKVDKYKLRNLTSGKYLSI